MSQPLFLKLGGSLITDKTGVEAVRSDVLARLAEEIAMARARIPEIQLVLGHGSGSFGHVAGAQYGTRGGVHTTEQWRGFTRVGDAAARLNRQVVSALLDAGVAAISLQPSASAICEDGQIIALAHNPVQQALNAGLTPVVFGDVAFDLVRGGTIISTEEVLVWLAGKIRPSWFLLAGETAGVLNEDGRVIPLITAENYDQVAPALSGSRGTDVTGGMASKVRTMLNFVNEFDMSSVRVFSGLESDNLLQLLVDPSLPIGTEIRSLLNPS